MPKGVYPHTHLKGKTYEEIHGEEKGRWMREIRKGKNNPSKNPEVIKKILETKRATRELEKHSQRMTGMGNPLFGKKRSCPWVAKRNRQYTGEKAFNWQGGKSFEPYGVEWTEALKERIRNRDNHTCQLCSKKYKKRKMPVHHIDGNKKNNGLNNLITLCISCHHKVHSIHTKKRGRKIIVYTFMCNDLFHIGHLKHIQQCSKLGNYLIVGILVDEAISTYKRKPIIPFNERMEITHAIRKVNWGVIQHSRNPTDNLRLLKPNIVAHGDDWPQTDRDLQEAKKYIESIGGKLVLTPYYKERTTSGIIQKIRSLKDEASKTS